jgi:hypothetical protein
LVQSKARSAFTERAFSCFLYGRATLTTEDAEDAEEKKDEEEQTGVESGVTVRNPVPPTFTVMGRQPMKGF